jgi:hypothetical protein
MKLFSAAALGLLAAAPAFASNPGFLVDFEQNWAYGTPVDKTYAASGVTFTNVLGLSNGDGLGSLTGGAYYENAPSPLGTAFAQLDGTTNTSAFMFVDGGVDNLTFYYATPTDVTGAIKAIAADGTVLASADLTATSALGYDTWNSYTLSFSGTAVKFDLTGAANGGVGLDNISAVPEASTWLMMLAGGAALLRLGARRRG